ncbi:MAG: hypothetical protein N2712_04365 [Brevinematales bacterium]|nr:hypothetical protein [Brevinematales bacterium]
MSEEVKSVGVSGFSNEKYALDKMKNVKNSVSQKVKEENIKAEVQKEREKEAKDKLKKSIISEDDLKVLLLVFGSRGSSVLLEKALERIEKEKKGRVLI